MIFISVVRRGGSESSSRLVGQTIVFRRLSSDKPEKKHDDKKTIVCPTSLAGGWMAEAPCKILRG